MPGRKKSALSPSNAARLVEYLIAEGKIIVRDIERYLEIDDLEKRLRALRGGEAPVPHVRSQQRRTRPVKRRRRRPVSAARRASQKIQGQYLGYIRQIAKGERPKFQRMAKTEGREKAIAAMRRRLGKTLGA